MNIFKQHRFLSLLIVSICITGIGCSKSFLNENNPGNRTTATYYTTASGFESLVTSCYPLLRDITQMRYLVFNGTDVMSGLGGWGPVYFGLPNPSGSAYDQYDVRLNASAPEIQQLWDNLYREINRANAAVDAAAKPITGETDSLLKIRVGEAKFLRALCYFWAVQQWGDIPMPLTGTTSGSLVVAKAKAADVYTQIIADLTTAVSSLPVVQTNTGRATQGAAQFLLARVYLTRGWNFNSSLGGSPADFTSSLQLCDQLISSGRYPLETNWNNLWPLHNTNPNKETATITSSVSGCNASKEVIFAVQYANASDYQGDPSNGTTLIGNNMHSQFNAGPTTVAQAARTTTYNRWNGIQVCNWAAYRLFDPVKDVRYNGTFNSVIYATTAGNISLANNKPNPMSVTLTYAVSDTTGIALPWTNPATTAAQRGVDIPGGTKHYSVINPNEYAGQGYINPTTPVTDVLSWGMPLFWKFFQPGVQYGDGYSTFNDPLFRSAEVYLMAAEAIVKGGTGAQYGTADVYYNKVLDRALGANAGQSPMCAVNPGLVNDPVGNVVSYRATPANITVDLILDERARELLGEGDQRWYDLKRTGTLISRDTKYNPWTAFGTNGAPLIAAKHYLRPIPQGEIDNSNPQIAQNPGY
ncbi:MAG TPA: RagB/SusD family nutrient uptake outer membrane protein [Puia sp.]|jgi:hypothetical protein